MCRMCPRAPRAQARAPRPPAGDDGRQRARAPVPTWHLRVRCNVHATSRATFVRCNQRRLPKRKRVGAANQLPTRPLTQIDASADVASIGKRRAKRREACFIIMCAPLPAHSGCSNAVPSDAMTLHHPLSQRMRLRRGRTHTPCAQSNLGKGAACSMPACESVKASSGRLRFSILVQVRFKRGDHLADLQRCNLLRTCGEGAPHDRVVQHLSHKQVTHRKKHNTKRRESRRSSSSTQFALWN